MTAYQAKRGGYGYPMGGTVSPFSIDTGMGGNLSFYFCVDITNRMIEVSSRSCDPDMSCCTMHSCIPAPPPFQECAFHAALRRPRPQRLPETSGCSPHSPCLFLTVLNI